MARETRLIPDLYFPDEDQELQTSSVEGEGGRGQVEEVKRKEPVDLTLEGFIPIHKLTLEDLPEPIRDEEHFQYILGVSKNVVKINNNRLSSKRPDDDQFKKSKQKSLSGSGYLLIDRNRSIVITTNRHVLFNEEELLNSTFDVFYEDDQKDPAEEGKKKMKLFKRTARRSGKYFVGKFSKDDIAQAVYQVKSTMEAHIKEHYFKDDVSERIKLYQHRDALDLDWTADPNTPPVVCLISHPLGQPKHVSFGEMVRYDLPSRIVYHTAPSKPGSSGGLLVVFQGIMLVSDIFHVGTDLLNGKKYRYARVQYKEISPLDVGDSILDAREEYILPENQSLDTSDENYVAKAGAFLEIASLAPFAPIFGAFLLRAEDKNLAGLDKSALKPCKTPLANEPPGSQGLKQSVKDIIQKLAKVAPSLILGHSESSSDACDLVPFLESQGPCYCQSIVKMMEKGVKLEDGTVTECFLSPYTATAKMSSDFDVT